MKEAVVQPTPSLIGKPVVNFTIEEYEALVHNKGYDVQIEKAIKCPCKTRDNDYLSTCQNCLGVGWVFVNAIQDRAVIYSINQPTQYKDWSAENLGTANISLMRRSKLSYMDKIIVLDSQETFGETLYPIDFNGTLFAYTIYDIDAVTEVFQFVEPTKPLLLLNSETDYTFERNKLILTTTSVADIAEIKALTGYINNQKALITGGRLYQFDETSTETPDDNAVLLPDDIVLPDPGRWLLIENLSISIRYQHKLQYYVLDIPNSIRNSYRKDNQGRDELQKLPVNGIIRLAHYVVDGFNFAGDNIFNNSYNLT
jgi:hypothetical protein